jgi:hypothetical protein
LKNLLTGEVLEGRLPPNNRDWRSQSEKIESRVSFATRLQPHSYAVFSLEKNRETTQASTH